MNIKKFLAQFAYIDELKLEGCDPAPAYFSKFDNSYIIHVGLEDHVKYLADKEITDELTHGIGFSPKDKKWYGWSHRAIYGFSIGSECKKGDCHYIGSDIEEQKEAALAFWANEDYSNVRCEGIIEDGDDKFFDIKWDYKDSTPNKKLHNTIGGSNHFITPLGRGEWTAKTMEDAKLMAIDFNKGFS